MPSPKNASRTMAEVRAECVALGLTPKRSIAATEEHIAEMKAYWDRRDAANRQAAAEARAAEKTARHAAKHRSGAEPFTGGYVTEVDAVGARKIVGQYREAYSPGMDVLMRECDMVMEVKRSFDTPKPKDQVRRDVRRKMRKMTRQAQRRARG